MPKYMLIINQSSQGSPELSPNEMQQIMQRLRAWQEQVRSSGKYVVSDKLREEGGKIVSRQNGRTVVTDGPYSEAKEVVGGYFTIRAENYDEAVAIVRECPFIEFGSVVIRQIDPAGCGDE